MAGGSQRQRWRGQEKREARRRRGREAAAEAEAEARQRDSMLDVRIWSLGHARSEVRQRREQEQARWMPWSCLLLPWNRIRFRRRESPRQARGGAWSSGALHVGISPAHVSHAGVPPHARELRSGGSTSARARHRMTARVPGDSTVVESHFLTSRTRIRGTGTRDNR